jgi:hypothetical protein
VLNEVAEMAYTHTDKDILRLYEIWMKTGSPRAFAILQRPRRGAGLAERAEGALTCSSCAACKPCWRSCTTHPFARTCRTSC